MRKLTDEDRREMREERVDMERRKAEQYCPDSKCYRTYRKGPPRPPRWYGIEWRQGKPEIRIGFTTRAKAIAWAKAAHESNCRCEKT